MRSLHVVRVVLGSTLVLMLTSPAWPWDDLGHMVVCEIAFQELNEKSRQEVTRLIRMDDRFTTFAESCTWPDNPKQRSSEHYVNVPRDFKAFTAQACPLASDCVFTAIEQDMAVLKDSTDDKVKLDSLNFLGHWIGDLHQPIHVSFEDDRGGGRIQTSGPCNVNLHGVWDGCIVTMKLGTDWRVLARDLRKSISASDRATWTSTKVEMWVNESLDIARSPGVTYCVQEGQSCAYEPGSPTYDPGKAEKVVVVDNAYLERNAPIVAERLKQAGVRLGHLLNTSLGK